MNDSGRAARTISQRRQCFARLGLESTASAEEVTNAYRQLAAQQHPDAGGAADAFHILERDYRDCLALVQERPRITGQPSRDDFSLRLPGRYSRLMVSWALLLTAAAALAALAGWSQSGSAIVLAVVVPIVAGCLVGTLSPGRSLFAAGVLLLALGLGWLAATYQISWITYAFDSVPDAAGGRDYVSAVSPEKQFWLFLAMISSGLTVVAVAIGCLIALTRRL